MPELGDRRRKLPYFQVVKADSDAVAAACENPRHLAYARSLYFVLLEAANDLRGDVVQLTRQELVDRSGVSTRMVADIARILVQAKVVRVASGREDGQPNTWTLVSADDEEVEEGGRTTPTRWAHHAQGVGAPCPPLKETVKKKRSKAYALHEVARARPRISGNPVNVDAWHLTEAVLAEFNQQTGRSLGLLTGMGEPSESAKRIYNRIRAYPGLTLEQHSRIIRNVLASKWWGSDPAAVGVVYGPKVWEENMTRPATLATNASGNRRPSNRPARQDQRNADRAIAIAAARERGEL